MTLKQKAKANPALAMFTSLGALAIAVMAIYNGIGLIDRIVLTEFEAAEIHAVFQETHVSFEQKIDAQSLLNECRWLSDKIDTLGYEIYVLERDNADADFIRSKRTVLGKAQMKFDRLSCVTLL